MAVRVGIFDSGVGGLSVWRALVEQIPSLETLYLADQAHIPYGSLAPGKILTYSRAIVRFLQARGCRMIVVACNTASAAALYPLREEFPEARFVGMEPAVKPAVQLSSKGVIGVLATPTTLEGELFTSTAKRHAGRAQILRQVCPGLVEAIEAGEVDGPRVEELLRHCLEPARAAGADTLVLACTHYPFARDCIQRILGADVQVIDPAGAIARHVERLLEAMPEPDTPMPRHNPQHRFVTTNDPRRFERVAQMLLDQTILAEHAEWDACGQLHP